MTDPQQFPDEAAPVPAEVEPVRKTCPRCMVPLLLVAYAKNATNPDGLQGTCRSCMAEYRRAYYVANKGRGKNRLAPPPDAELAEQATAPGSTLVPSASSPSSTEREDVSGNGGHEAQAHEREREREVEIEHEIQSATMAELAVTAIVASRTNPRKHFNAEFINGLAESIKTQGLAQPILVRPLPGDRLQETYSDRRADAPRPTHEIVAGEQRWRAAQIAGLRRIPAFIRHLDDEAVLQLQLVENLKRRDLHPMEEAEGYERLRRDIGLGVDTIAQRIGKSLVYVYNSLKLLDLEPEARDAFYAGEMTQSVAELVAKRPPNLQIQLLKEVTAKDHVGDSMSFRKARALVEQRYMLRLSDAPFNTADPLLVPAAGACGPCPKRTGSNPQLFQEVTNRDTCTDTHCFGTKKDAHYARIRVEAETRGQPVIVGKEAREIMQASGKLVGYTRIDDPQAMGGQMRTLRAVLGDAMPTPTLVEDPTTREMIAVLPTTQVGQLLKAQGIAKAEAKASAEDVERQGLVRFEQTWRTRAIERIHTETERRIVGLGPEVLRLVALQLLDTLTRDQRHHICKLLNIGTVGDLEGIQDAIADCAPGQLESLLLLVFIEHDMARLVNVDGTHTHTPRIAAVASDLGVDLDEIRDSVREETVAQLQPTPAAAKVPRKGKASAAEVQAQIAAQLQALDSQPAAP
jgi:ParB/RepB/Spo0J family partition protein